MDRQSFQRQGEHDHERGTLFHDLGPFSRAILQHLADRCDEPALQPGLRHLLAERPPPHELGPPDRPEHRSPIRVPRVSRKGGFLRGGGQGIRVRGPVRLSQPGGRPGGDVQGRQGPSPELQDRARRFRRRRARGHEDRRKNSATCATTSATRRGRGSSDGFWGRTRTGRCFTPTFRSGVTPCPW